MWSTAVYVAVALWAGFTLGQLVTHHWYYNHFQETLKLRIYEPPRKFESVQERLADQGERRLEMMDRQAPETDAKLFSAAVLSGFLYYLQSYLREWW